MKKRYLMIIALLLVAIGAYFVGGVYARYTEKVEQSGDVTVAKWTFTEDNAGATETFDIKLDSTYDPETLVGEKIAPGTSGSFDIKLYSTNTETGVDVTVGINKENVPANLKFYSDENHTTEFAATELNAYLTPNDSTGLTKTIYWEWAYNEAPDSTIDGADTNVGKAATNANGMKVKLTITGTQAKPIETNGTTEVSEWK